MTGFSIVTGDSPALLLDHLLDHITADPLPPFVDDVIVVQSQGMDRWITQTMARRIGCAASVEMPFPAAFCQQLARMLQGEPLDPRFEEDALTWRVDALLADAAFMADPVFAPLQTYLADADDVKRHRLAIQVAQRFDEYRLFRPDWLLQWEAGASTIDSHQHDAWQRTIWRRLTGADEVLSDLERPRHFARWFHDAIADLESRATAPADFPPRIAVFGVSTLPPLFIRLLRVAARFIPVTCYVYVPTADATLRHPLDRAFGETARELVAALCDGDASPAITHRQTAGPAESVTLLQSVQQRIREGVAASSPISIAADDRSLLVHSAHSPMRELEVLRDQLLDAFATDPTLRPHDILVMVPDVTIYGPLAATVFGRRPGDEGPGIPFRVADRAVGHDNAPARALDELLQLVTSRVALPAVLDLLALPVVRRKAGLGDAPIDDLADRLNAAGVRWGIDADHRATHFDVPAFGEHSWREGLDRLLAGYAAGAAPRLVHGLAPVAGDVLGDAERLGKLIAWFDALFAILDTLRMPRPLREWSAVLQDTLDWLVAPQGAEESTGREQVVRALERLGDSTADDSATRQVPFSVIRGWLKSVLMADARHAGFMTGGVTLCAMKPMRAIPFRVIAMLGLDHATFPRRDRRAAFDLIEGTRRSGDRDPRADDRQLFLDTLLCAQDRLILSYVGRNAIDNSERAMSVVLGELLDQLDREYVPPTGTQGVEGRQATARHYIHVEHALQPFHPVYYTGEDARRFSFDPVWQHGIVGNADDAAAAATFTADVVESGPNAPPNASLDGIERIALDDLIEAWTEPARFYCKRVLGIALPGEAEGLEADEPFVCDGLTGYTIKEALLNDALAGRLDEQEAMAWHAASGHLPIGAGGIVAFRTQAKAVRPLVEQLQALSWRAPVDVVVGGEDWRIEGALDRVCSDGPVIFRPGELKAKHEVRAWIHHLLACVALDDMTQTRLLELDAKKARGWPALSSVDAHRYLHRLVAGYREMRTRPIAVFPEAAKAWIEQADPARQLGDAQRAFAPESDRTRREADDQYVRYLWRGFEDVLTAREAEFARFATLLFEGVPRKDKRSKRGAGVEGLA